MTDELVEVPGKSVPHVVWRPGTNGGTGRRSPVWRPSVRDPTDEAHLILYLAESAAVRFPLPAPAFTPVG